MSHKDLPYLLKNQESPFDSSAENADVATLLSTLAEKKQRQRDRYAETIGPFYKYTSDELKEVLERNEFTVERTRAVDRHSIFVEPFLANAWEDEQTREAVIQYERTVGSLPWFRDTGNMSLHVSQYRPSG